MKKTFGGEWMNKKLAGRFRVNGMDENLPSVSFGPKTQLGCPPQL